MSQTRSAPGTGKPPFKITYKSLFTCAGDGIKNGVLTVKIGGKLGRNEADWERYKLEYTTGLTQPGCRTVVCFDLRKLKITDLTTDIIMKKWNLVVSTRRFTSTRSPLVVIMIDNRFVANVIGRIIKAGNQASPYVVVHGKEEAEVWCKAGLLSHYHRLDMASKAAGKDGRCLGGTPDTPICWFVRFVCMLTVFVGPNVWRK